MVDLEKAAARYIEMGVPLSKIEEVLTIRYECRDSEDYEIEVGEQMGFDSGFDNLPWSVIGQGVADNINRQILDHLKGGK